MITQLSNDDVGKWIFYSKRNDDEDRGKIKSFNNKTQTAWVVYKCNDNWDADHWKNYTGQGTKYSDLTF